MEVDQRRRSNKSETGERRNRGEEKSEKVYISLGLEK